MRRNSGKTWIATWTILLTALVAWGGMAAEPTVGENSSGPLLQVQPVEGGEHAIPERITPAQMDRLHQRIALVEAILDKHQFEAESLGLASGWRQARMESLFQLPVNRLREVSGAGSLDEVTAAVVAASGEGAVEADTLGSLNTDLVFRPVTPCRFIDTRFGGGKISGTRAFDLSVDGSTYGGSAACDPETIFGVVDDEEIGAIAMNVTILAPAGAPGFLAAKPTSASPTSSLLNWYEFGPSVQASNQGAITINQTFGNSENFVIQTSSAVHVIVDFFGAFVAPAATPLQIFVQLETWSLTSGSFTVLATCPAGYTVTGGGWNHGSGSFDAISMNRSSREGNGWQCRGFHTGLAGSTQAGDCAAVCARVPGL